MCPERTPPTPSGARWCQSLSGARQAGCLRPAGVGGPLRRREAGRSHRPSLCERRLPWAAWRSPLGREPAQEQPLAERSSPNSLVCLGAVRGAYCVQLLSAGHGQNLLCAASQLCRTHVQPLNSCTTYCVRFLRRPRCKTYLCNPSVHTCGVQQFTLCKS